MTEERYGSARVKKGVIHFITGKGVSSIAGFFAMILVVRLLSIESFAAYSVLTAFVELLTGLSGMGLVHVLLRYVPELYTKHYKVALRDLIVRSTLLRIAILVIGALGTFALADSAAALVGLGSAIDAFKVFLLVVVLRSTTHFLSQILESTLHQGITQLAYSAAAIARLIGMAILSYGQDTSLARVIWFEAAADALALAFMAYGVAKVVISAPVEQATPIDDSSWLKTHIKTLVKFAAQGYLQHLAILPCGGHTNRLIGGHMLSVSAMANFGFAQTLYEYVKRYLPAQLLIGLIRPIVVSRYVKTKDFSVAARLCGQVVQINFLLMGICFALLAVAGPEILLLISKDKYGFDAAWILIALFFVLILETQRQQLELLVQTVEQYQLLIPSNLLLSSSVLVAIAAVPSLGAIAFPISNALGLLITNEWVRYKLRSGGAAFNLDWTEISLTLIATLSAISAGWLVKFAGAHWVAGALTATVIYLLLAYLLGKPLIQAFVSELTAKTNRGLPTFTPNVNSSPLKIAFGVLSSKASAQAIDEIAAQVAPHPVYVHHDFSKQADFAPLGKNIIVLDSPVVTAWGDWSLIEGTYLLMDAALKDPDVSHFQLLSESCLAVRPIAEFENYLSTVKPDFMLDFIYMNDVNAQLSHGWRYFGTGKHFQRMVRRSTVWSFTGKQSYLSQQSVNVRVNDPASPIGCRAWVCRIILRASWHLFRRRLLNLGLETMAIGGQWFGASRAAAQWLIDARFHNAELAQHFQQCHIPDEAYIHSLVVNGKIQNLPFKLVPSNHFLTWKSCGNGPDTLTSQDIPELLASGKFFARKMPIEVDAQVRKDVHRSCNAGNFQPEIGKA